MLGKCGICGSELTIHNSEPFVEQQQVRVRHVPTNCAQVLYAKLTKSESRIAELERQPRVRPGHHPPCKAMLDSEAECTCGQ
jgi:hypothetical protein